MTDQIELNEESTENKAEVKARKKPGPTPGSKKIGKGIQASRISYKDRGKISATGRDPKFIYRIVNHDGNKYAGNVEKRMQMGYKFANEGESLGDLHGVKAGQIGSKIGTHVGSGTQGILMKIPKEYYNQDQAEKQTEVDRTELGMVDEELKNSDGMYGEGLKVADGQGTRLEMKVRNT